MYRSFLEDWQLSRGVFLLLIGAIFVDILLGNVLAFAQKRLSSSISRVGMARKIGMVLLVGFCALLDAPFPNVELNLPGLQTGVSLTFSGLAAILFFVTEGISITEKGAQLGLPMPARVRDALIQVRNAIEDKDTMQKSHISKLWLIGTEGAATARGFFRDVNGNRVGDSFTVTIPATGNTPVNLIALAGRMAGAIAGASVTFDNPVAYDFGDAAASDFTSNPTRFPVYLESPQPYEL